jgi:DNA-binding winged helix-turn-helix (wHTH) protein
MQGVDQSQGCIRFEGFELDLRAGEVRSLDTQNGGKTVRLAEQPFLILTILLERPGQVVTREEIRKRLWPNDTIVEFEHSMSAAMNRLRQVLGDSAENPRYIETLARRGYRFICPIDVGAGFAPPSSPDAPIAPARAPQYWFLAKKRVGDEKKDRTNSGNALILIWTVMLCGLVKYICGKVTARRPRRAT